MKRTDAHGNVANQFSDGVPAEGIAATMLDASWCNNVQEELATIIEGAGIVLNGAVQTQLLAAIKEWIQRGAAPAGVSIALANNQVAPANLLGLVFDYTQYRGVRIQYSIHRQTDAPTELDGIGELYLWYKPVAAVWKINPLESNDGDDHGVTFDVTAAGQVTYTSTNLAGANHACTMRVNDVKLLKI